MKLNQEQLDRLAKKDWRLGENIGTVVQKKTLEGYEIEQRFIRLENDDGELLVVRERLSNDFIMVGAGARMRLSGSIPGLDDGSAENLSCSIQRPIA
jgi:hypothetical protein